MDAYAYADAGSSSAAAAAAAAVTDNKFCPGCQQSVMDENGGVVIAFGQSFFHVDCFKCAKCHNKVTADTNLLLLSDGQPVCSNCSYSCSVCHQPILDEAIMTGDDSYHAHCFKCRACHNRIDELMFAKTSHGIYCMNCHHQRVARSRRHAQKQKERDKSVGTNGSGSSKSREAAASNHHRENGTGSPYSAGTLSSSTRPSTAQSTPIRDGPSLIPPSRSNTLPLEERSSSPVVPPRRGSVTSSNDHNSNSTHTDSRQGHDHPLSPAKSPGLAPADISGIDRYLAQGRRPSLPVITASPNDASFSSDLTAHPPTNTNSNTNNGLLSPTSESSGHSVPALNIPNKSSRAAKRGSILPGTVVDIDPSMTTTSGTSPIQGSFPARNGNGIGNGNISGRSSPFTNRSASPSPQTRPPLEHSSSSSSSINGKTNNTTTTTTPYLRSRAETSSTYLPEHPKPQQQDSLGVGGRPPLKSSLTLERIPARPNTAGSSSVESLSLRAASPAGIRPQRSFDDRLGMGSGIKPLSMTRPGGQPTNLSIDVEKSRSPYGVGVGLGSATGTGVNRSRPTSPSPAHIVDVPHGIESGTDDSKDGSGEDDDEDGDKDKHDLTLHEDKPPELPEKEARYRPRPEQLKLQPTSGSNAPSALSTPIPTATATEPDSSLSLSLDASVSTLGTGAGAGAGDDSDDASPVDNMDNKDNIKHISQTTFIAPALPPIRFSTGPGDLASLLSGLGGGLGKEAGGMVGAGAGKRSSMKDLDQLVKMGEETMRRLDENENETTGSAPGSPPPAASVTTPPPSAGTTNTWMSIHESASATSSKFSDDSTMTTTVEGGTSTVPTSQQSHDNLPGKFALPGALERSYSADSGAGVGRIPPLRQNSLGSTGPTVEKARLQQQQNKVGGGGVAAFPQGLGGHGRSTSSDIGQVIIPRPRNDSTASFSQQAQITITGPGSSSSRPVKFGGVGGAGGQDEMVIRRLQEALSDAGKRGAAHVNLDREFVQAIVAVVEQRRNESFEMKGRLDGMKRASKQYIDGLTVAQGEYDKELSARREAEAEVTRLRILLAGQAARITALSGESRKGEVQKQRERELTDNLSGLEKDMAKLKVERDVTLAEVEELVSSKSASNLSVDNEASTSRLGRSFSIRLDSIKTQYASELVPLTEQREALVNEIAELKAARDVFLEETTMLNARNEELAQLNALYARRIESAPVEVPPIILERAEKRSDSFDRQRTITTSTMNGNGNGTTIPPSNTVLTTSSSAAGSEDSSDKFIKVQKPDSTNGSPATANNNANTAEGAQTLRGKFKWMAGGGGGNKINKENIQVVSPPVPAVTASPEPKQAVLQAQGMDEGPPRGKHVFQQISVLRITRCDYCGDKLWGSLIRCTQCNSSVHPRCVAGFGTACSPHAPAVHPAHDGPLPPSMFGRDLIEQVRADSRGDSRMVPVIVEKCIQAVELSALDYEGIYRKTGGSGSTKMITQLFERGDYAAFDLHDSDKFNDICSITSVLKSYFRALPNPLLTYALHDEFMHASTTKDQALKVEKYADLVKQLPTEHYYTLRLMMLHLHRIHLRSEVNLMTARNLGVVFGPTLMRSRDPGAEFNDMAGKALSVECMVEYAPEIFPPIN